MALRWDRSKGCLDGGEVRAAVESDGDGGSGLGRFGRFATADGRGGTCPVSDQVGDVLGRDGPVVVVFLRVEGLATFDLEPGGILKDVPTGHEFGLLVGEVGVTHV